MRAATFADLPVLKQFEQGVVAAERPFNTDIKLEQVHYYDLEYLINDLNTYMLVVEKNGEIIASGYSQLRKSKEYFKSQRHGYLGFMYVKPEYRGLGLNKLVMDELIKWSKKQSVHDFYLDVYCENQAAIRAYEKIGFTQSLVEMKLNTD